MMKNHKIEVNKRYQLIYSPPIVRTAGSGGALWVQRDSPDFRARTRGWAQTNFVELWSVSRSRLAEMAIEI